MIAKRAAMLAASACLVAGLSGCSGGGTELTVQLGDSAGLFAGNDVGVLGVPVGKVDDIVPRGSHVDVKLHVDEGVRIPANAGAVVVSRSVATDRYVELTPVYAGGPVMASGAVIGRSRTKTPVEFDDLLASLKEISDDLGGAGAAQPLNRALGLMARAADGNGARVARAMHDLATTLESADSSSGDFADTIRNLDVLTSALAANDRTARDFTHHVAGAVDLLNDESGSLEDTVDLLTEMIRKVTEFVEDHRGQIGHQIKDFRAIVRALVADNGNLAEVLETLPLMLQNGQRAITADNHLNFLTRPTDLVPTEAGFAELCANFPAGFCDPFTPGATHLFDLFKLLAGVT